MYRGNIIEDIRKDRAAGADRLVAEYKNRLYNVAYGICGDEHEAEDLVFCTFEQVIAKIDDYQEQDAFFGWMCTILRNYHKMSVRAAVARNTVPSGGLGELAGLIGGTATDGVETLGQVSAGSWVQIDGEGCVCYADSFVRLDLRQNKGDNIAMRRRRALLIAMMAAAALRTEAAVPQLALSRIGQDATTHCVTVDYALGCAGRREHGVQWLLRSRQAVGDSLVAAVNARERYSCDEKPERLATSFIGSKEVESSRFASSIRACAICF